MAKVKTTMKKNIDTGEWEVRLHVDGKFIKDATYYTNDRDDALGTAEAMKQQAEKNLGGGGGAFGTGGNKGREMSGGDVQRFGMFLANLTLEKVANVYGYSAESLSEPMGSFSYINSKLTTALNNPAYWLTSLDNTNLKNLANLLNEYQR